jgi:hypothetical protein
LPGCADAAGGLEEVEGDLRGGHGCWFGGLVDVKGRGVSCGLGFLS